MMMRSTRTRIAAIVATIAMVGSVVTPAFATTYFNIDGSTTLQPMAGKWAKVFMASHSSFPPIQVAGGGSGTGIADAKSGKVAMGMSSRQQATNGSESWATFTPVCRDSLVIVVNKGFYKKYPKYIYRLSPMTVQNIFRGKITKWKQINSHLPNHAIDLVGRTGSSGTYTYFKQMFMTDGTPTGEIGTTMYKQSARTRTYASNGSVRAAVTGDMYAIGYLSDAYVNSKVQPMNMPFPAHYYVNYVEYNTPPAKIGKWEVPSTASAIAGNWPYVRPLYFVTNGAPSGNALEFINWCLSTTGQAYCPGMHYLKLH